MQVEFDGLDASGARRGDFTLPPMISVLVRVERGVEALAATLGSLVPAVRTGLVADAVVLARGPNETSPAWPRRRGDAW